MTMKCIHGVLANADCLACERVTPCEFDASHMQSDCTCTFQVTAAVLRPPRPWSSWRLRR